MAPPDHQQLGMARANVFFEASLFSSATGSDVRPPHMRINDVVGTGFARLPIGCPADPPALARLVQVNLDRSVLADRLFVDPIYEDRKSVVSGKSVSVRVDLGGRRILKKKKNKYKRVHN